MWLTHRHQRVVFYLFLTERFTYMSIFLVEIWSLSKYADNRNTRLMSIPGKCMATRNEIKKCTVLSRIKEKETHSVI